MEESVARFTRLAVEGETRFVTYVNPEQIMMARRKRDLLEWLESADLILPDGLGVVLAGRTLGIRISERVAGTDFMPRVARIALEHGLSLYLLGGGRGVAEQARERLMKDYPGIRIVGCHHGYSSGQEEQELLEDVRAKKPAILLVCLGGYRQEKWIVENREGLGVGVCFANGGALDFVSGRLKRAPWYMQKLGLEWLFRLLQEPWRWRRQLALAEFLLTVLATRLRRL
jgi:N-acetylglucosaminyldiphosphoundecaprenol N-acetyl-beta-D-mannosaminyltransferase